MAGCLLENLLGWRTPYAAAGSARPSSWPKRYAAWTPWMVRSTQSWRDAMTRPKKLRPQWMPQWRAVKTQDRSAASRCL